MSEQPKMSTQARDFIEDIYQKASDKMISHAVWCDSCVIKDQRIVALCPEIRAVLAREVAICDCTSMDMILGGYPMNRDVIKAIHDRMNWKDTTAENHD